MKQLLILIFFFFLTASATSQALPEKQNQQADGNFRLQFITVGFGSNMFEMQPVFKVDGTRFVYTSEEVWILPDQTHIQRDTLLVGRFRQSSIDSISDLIREIKDSVIYRTNIHIMSGAAAYITIEEGGKKIKFNLHNASHAIADSIVAILNTYTRAADSQLGICCGPAPGTPEPAGPACPLTAEERKYIFTKVEIQATFKPFAENWFAYAQKNFDFGAVSRALPRTVQKFHDSVFLRFIVTKEGAVCSIEFLKGNTILKDPAIQLLRKSSPWVPAITGSRTVNAYRVLKIEVVMDKEKNKFTLVKDYRAYVNPGG